MPKNNNNTFFSPEPKAEVKEQGWLDWVGDKIPSAQNIAYYNLLVGSAVLYQYMNDPDASTSEYGSDIFIHFMQAWIGNNANVATFGFSTFLNLHRMTSIFEHTLAGDSTIPFTLNMIDLLVNHTANLCQTYEAFENSCTNDSEQQSAEDKPQTPKTI